MKSLLAVLLAVPALAHAAPAFPPTAPGVAHGYPSCDLAAQRALRAPVGGSIRDPMRAHISMRADILEADIGSARKARLLSAVQAQALWRRVERVRRGVAGFVAGQGFLSAGERASYDRELDAVADRLCR